MTGNQDLFSKAMNQGHTAAWDQTWNRAASFYRQALEEFPENPKALTSLGLALFESQQYDEAMVCYRKAATLLPTDPMPFEKVARICERTSRLNDAIQAYLQAADLHVKNRDMERAIECWLRITRFNAEHLVAHSRLAVTYERLGRKAQAVQEYLAVASIIQRSGAPDKAVQAINYALQIVPDNQDAQHALVLVRSNQLLPRPVRTRGGTGSLRPPEVIRMEETEQIKSEDSKLDPVAETHQKALITLADILFESTEESAQRLAGRRAAGQILRGSAGATPEQAQQATVMRHLGFAIDAQTQGNDNLAANELGKSVEAGLGHPAAYFMLGLLNASQEHPEVSLRDLQTAVKHPDYALAGRLLLGQTMTRLGRWQEAATNFLKALQIADAEIVPEDQAELVFQMYEPLIEAQAHEKDEKSIVSICENISALLFRPEWRTQLETSREKLPPQPEGSPPLLLAEMLLETRSNEVVDSLATIRYLTDQNLLRTAMEEAFTALLYVPTYLPLHSQIGEILLKEDHVVDAIDKFSVVAQAYSARGEATQACALLRRLVKLAPLDLNVRKRLIDQLVASGQIDEAIRGYLDLADIYYHQADLEAARSIYSTALRLAQGSQASRAWSVDILFHVADIELQRLDLRGALRIYEQIRMLQPEEAKARISIISLNYRMSQEMAALSEIESFVSYLHGKGQEDKATKFISSMLEEHPEMEELVKRATAAKL